MTFASSKASIITDGVVPNQSTKGEAVLLRISGRKLICLFVAESVEISVPKALYSLNYTCSNA